MEMKKCLVVGAMATFLGTGAWAQEAPKVEITSFVRAGSRTRASEICGKVTGMNQPFMTVKVVVDPKYKSPGTYNTVVGSDGRFCLTVVSYTGLAEAMLWNADGTLQDQRVSASLEN